MRVSLDTHAPLTLPGMLSTAKEPIESCHSFCLSPEFYHCSVLTSRAPGAGYTTQRTLQFSA
jgi:hypothetical protein